MKVVVLGAGGFIGSSVVKIFEEDNAFEIIGFKSADTDLNNTVEASLFLSQHIGDAVVVFCAGRHRQRGDNYEIMLENITIVRSLIEAAEMSCPSHLIFLSSVEVYGAPETMPITENTPFNPSSLYAVGKVTCEQMLQCFSHSAGVPLSILRLPGIYGPDDGGTSIITRLVRTTRKNGVFQLFGDGADLRDYVHVEDLAEIILQISLENRGLGTINIASGISVELKDLMYIVEGVHGPCQIEQKTESGVHFNLVFDPIKLLTALPKTSFKDLHAGIKSYE